MTANVCLPQMQPKPLPRPLGLIAELTYRCPLHCPYCSNPVHLSSTRAELSTEEWRRVLTEAAELGVVHALLTGGEPLARKDLEELVAVAREAGLYTNLITSAIGLNQARAQRLKAVGLDSVQISFQSDEASLADAIAGTQAHERKLQAARLVRKLGVPLTVNAPLHRANIDRLEGIIAMAQRFGAIKLELANVQFYGWAMWNRTWLLPTRGQIADAERIAAAARECLAATMQVVWVTPDYYADRPKPCMNGWGQRYVTVNPVGDALPCPTAGEIQSLRFDNVREHTLEWIWRDSPAFNRFRGTVWMPEPCRSCDRREIDFGGCRCQAFLLTGDASNTDPACAFSPHHGEIVASVREAQDAVVRAPSPADSLVPLTYRKNP